MSAFNDQLETLKYAHENGCPWNELVCSYASGEGNLEVLKYARRNGCPWDKNICYNEAMLLADKSVANWISMN
jgi:uncharacterized protein YabN with tetrapyrrole methylase and pyrophosphatase domain